MKHPSLAGMVDAISVAMTCEAMHATFTPQSQGLSRNLPVLRHEAGRQGHRAD
jgi:hypothetical protein